MQGGRLPSGRPDIAATTAFNFSGLKVAPTTTVYVCGADFFMRLLTTLTFDPTRLPDLHWLFVGIPGVLFQPLFVQSGLETS